MLLRHTLKRTRYQVTITGVPFWIRLTALDGAPLRVDGKEAYNVWGKDKGNGTLILDVLVHL
jgi:hypothetical protein